jgi:hypothetical protein
LEQPYPRFVRLALWVVAFQRAPFIVSEARDRRVQPAQYETP